MMLKQLPAVMLAGLYLAGCATPPLPVYPMIELTGPTVTDPALINRDDEADPVSLCDLQRELENGTGRSRLVSITANVFYEHHGGFTLADSGCRGSAGLPESLLTLSGSDDGTITALGTFWSTAEQNFGSRSMCVCTGQITFADSVWTFHLVRVERVWWEKP